jgi:hypothetical protein
MSDDRGGAQHALIGALMGPDEPELTCEGCFEELDGYVELTLAGHSAERAMPAMRAHLDGCPACRDDHDSLLAFVRRCGAGPHHAAGKTRGPQGANRTWSNS